ncbi:uncharacterized protein MEPE_01868 [Melanopsichium pennsylvanicum]|uniref:Uncharacterized protein n=2 Tax=Melanopsichium pennsylvanicum TaxID=63383 RepID=A0AAJ5C417_9BASI|nr:hypothetical protein BN887_04075 [Melanopsichium pennsylvanicum 4]SNX83162.1 uncharacterized protein MEPE_01868 [Melanopsichium pennsylvanicum]
MPLLDASRPSRRQALAWQRKRHGAYDPFRLPNSLQRRYKSQLQRRSSGPNWPYSMFELQAHRSLFRRDATSGDATDQPGGDMSISDPPSPAMGEDDLDPTIPSSLAPINYGNSKPESSTSAPATAGVEDSVTRDDTASTVTSASSPSDPAGQDETSSGSNLSKSVTHPTRKVIILISGVVILLIVFLALGCFYKRYRRKLTPYSSSTDSDSPKKNRRKFKGLGSIDSLRSMVAGGKSQRGPALGEVRSDKLGSQEHLVAQDVNTGCKAGPFDKALQSMLLSPKTDRNQSTVGPGGEQQRKSDCSKVTIPKQGLTLQRSLESIAEAPEPSSGTSSTFALQTGKRDSAIKSESTPEKRQTWADHRRPKTSPGRTSTLSTLSASPTTTLFNSPELPNRRSSLARPQSAKGMDIEMTKQGNKLVIRGRPSTGTLLRPLSSAGSGIRDALRRGRGSNHDGDVSICVDMEDNIDHEGDNVHRSNLTSAISGIMTPAHDARGDKAEVGGGVLELTLASPRIPQGGRGLQSHFSTSTLRTQTERNSYATGASTSPNGSFSFEIKDAVIRGAPLTLKSPPPSSENVNQSSAQEVKDEKISDEKKSSTATYIESFVKDLDWDLRDSSLSIDSTFLPSINAFDGAVRKV